VEKMKKYETLQKIVYTNLKNGYAKCSTIGKIMLEIANEYDRLLLTELGCYESKDFKELKNKAEKIYRFYNKKYYEEIA
jgi:hypothetical protein